MDKFLFKHHISQLVVKSAVLVSMALLSGCCTQRRVVDTTMTITEKDSTNTEVRVETQIVYVPDTVFIEIPAQIAERTTQDSTSHLENDYATSDARINADGSLFHNLNTKPQKKPVEVQTPTIRKDSIKTEYKIIDVEKEVEKKVPVEVEKKLTWWQSTCIKFFPWSLILIALSIGFYFRKPIWNIIKRFL